MATVCEFYQIEPLELLSNRRTGHLIRPRQVAGYLCCELTLRSLPEIGRMFRRDHTTILHSRQKIASERRRDEGLAAEIETLTRRIAAQEARA